MSRTIRAARLRGPIHRPGPGDNVVPIEQLRAEALLGRGGGGPHPPAGGGDLETPRPMAGAAMILRALWPVVVALVRVAWAALAWVFNWTVTLTAWAVLLPFVFAWHILRVAVSTWWVWVLVLVLLVL